MNNENVDPKNESGEQTEENKEKPLPFHNPLKPDDPRVITEEDLENEQKYKEALSERD